MILLDNLTSILKPGLAFLLIPFFFACHDPSELGLELERENEKVAVSDTTLILPSSTIYIDSLRTDQYTSPAFGKSTSEVYGSVTAISNIQYDRGGGTFPGDSLDFESVVLKLEVNDLRAASVLSSEHVTVYESPDTIFRGAVYFKDRLLTRAETPIGDHDFSFDPEIDSVISIPLSDSFGRSLYAQLVRASNDDDFKDSLVQNRLFYKPLIIEPGESNQGLFLLDLSNAITSIYVHMKNAKPEDDSTYTFTWDFNSTTRYTSIVRDRGVEDDYDEIAVDGEKTYLSSINGVFTKIDLTPLIELYESRENLIFNTVQLSLTATASDGTYIDPVRQLMFFLVQPNGRIDGTRTASQSASRSDYIKTLLLTESGYISGTAPAPLVMSYNEKEMTYSSSISLFSQALGESYNEETGKYLARELVVMNPSGIGLGQTSLLKSEIKLKIYYSTLIQ